MVKTGIEEYNIAAHEAIFRSNSNSDQVGLLLCSCKKLFHVGRRPVLTAYSLGVSPRKRSKFRTFQYMTRGSNG